MTQQVFAERADAPPADRVRSHTAEELNRAVDRDTRQCIQAFASRDREQVTRHIQELEREWDVERYLQTDTSILALAEIVLGARLAKILVRVRESEQSS
jgi:hypothetical protein